MLARAGQPGYLTAAQVSGQVDLGGRPAAGPADPLPAGFPPGPQPVQDHLPGPVQGPAAMPVMDGFPVPEARRQVPPRAARTSRQEDPVDDCPVIGPPVTALLRGRTAGTPAGAPFPHRSGHGASGDQASYRATRPRFEDPRAPLIPYRYACGFSYGTLRQCVACPGRGCVRHRPRSRRRDA
jgi:hypothetical protein